MTLRSAVIRLAHQDPSLRPHLLPLLKSAGRAMFEPFPGDMLDPAQVEAAKKYYETQSNRAWDAAKSMVGKAIQGGSHSPDASVEKWLREALHLFLMASAYSRFRRFVGSTAQGRGDYDPPDVPSSALDLEGTYITSGLDSLFLTLRDNGDRAKRALTLAEKMYNQGNKFVSEYDRRHG